MKKRTTKFVMLLTVICMLALTGMTVFATGTVEETAAPTMTARFVDALKANNESILAGFAALGSIIIALSYKKGLLPLLRKGLGQLSNVLKGGLDKANASVEELKASNDTQMKALAEAVTPMLEKAAVAMEQAAAAQEKISALEKSAVEEQNARKVLSTVLSAQMEMFYQFFMAVNMPQYQKDKLGETYLQMKKKITDASSKPKEASEEVNGDV